MADNEEHGLQVTHSQLLGKLEEGLEHAHKRINNLDIFIEEMRKIGNGMLEMNGNVRLLAQEIKTISKTQIKHEEAIENIQSQMETKEGMARLYKFVEELAEDHESLAQRMQVEENKEATDALALIKSIKAWILASLGAIILAVVMLYLKLS